MDILVVEDEPQLASHVVRALERANHDVVHAADGPSAVETAGNRHFDLVVLDVNLPGFDGFEVLSRIRAAGLPPRVLMLTARSEIGDRVAGLKAGADDYLTKPFALEELLARVEALGRRGTPAEQSSVLHVGDLCLDAAKRRFTRGGERIDLSPREIEVLHIFMQEPGRTFSRDEICERIWEREHEYDTRTVEIFIMRLRKKIDRKDAPSIITTVRGVGYHLEAP
ncbi:MAG: response regulator transcription factor [Akkermansiaceae bacterium]|nr:response regulator transcription factor [Akkermansiaceae bacterium]MCP5544106.1 response regulator transcription factor [Akkermansiaceae bacterium]MCP5547838.1 response regulator transcription factor [Akkermansiaceae bacterium]